MLPMFDKKKVASVVISRMGKKDQEVSPEVEASGQEIDPSLKEAGMDVLRAIEAKSPVALAKALQAAYQLCESAEPMGDENE